MEGEFMRRLQFFICLIATLLGVQQFAEDHNHFKVQARLFPTVFQPTIKTSPGYGITVAQNDDFVFVAAPATSTDTTGGLFTGAVYVYKRDGNTWKNTQIITRTEFVNTPSIFAINFTGLFQVASQKDWLFISSVGPFLDKKGSVLIYRLNPKTSHWDPAQILDSSTPGLSDLAAVGSVTGERGALFGLYFGADVEHGHLIVGAQSQLNTSAQGNPLVNSGAAYIFKLDQETQLWKFKQKLLNPRGVAANDYFGANVAIHDDIALVGSGTIVFSRKTTPSSVYVFQHKNDKWKYVQRLHGRTLTDKAPAPPITVDPTTVDGFGRALAINKEWVVVTAPLENKSDAQPFAGAVYFYRIDPNPDAKKRLHFKQKFFPNTASSLFIGAFHVALHDHVVLVPDPARTGPTGNLFQGGILKFLFNGHKWVRGKTIFDPQGNANDFFGEGVSVQWDYAVGGTDTLLFPLLLSSIADITAPAPSPTPDKVLIFKRK